jgi:hypothetical protein
MTNPTNLIHGSDEHNESGHSCATAVIIDTVLADDDGIKNGLERLFPGTGTRYDLLSTPDLDGLLRDEQRFGFLIEDILIAIRLHQTERLAVIASETVRQALAERLTSHPMPAVLDIRSAGLRPETRDSKLLAIGCMDWRLHGHEGGFKRLLADGFGDASAKYMTMPGAAKDLTDGTARGRALLPRISALVEEHGLKRIVLVAHTDCGKYGGRAAFAGPDDEMNCLVKDMKKAAEFLASNTDAKVALAVAHIGRHCTDKIVEVQ